MFISYSINNSPFSDIVPFLIERYHLPKDEIQAPLLEFMIDGAVSLELQEYQSRVYLIGVVVEPLLINEDHEALALLKIASTRLGMTEGVLAWDDLKKRLVFWMEVTRYTQRVEFDEHFNRFLNHLDTWISLVPR
jgi:hypothetical protein